MKGRDIFFISILAVVTGWAFTGSKLLLLIALIQCACLAYESEDFSDE